MALSNAERCKRHYHSKKLVLTLALNEIKDLQKRVNTLELRVNTLEAAKPQPGGENGRRRQATPNLAAWQPSKQHYQQATAYLRDTFWLEERAAEYRDWQLSTGKRHKDLDAGFRNWIKRAIQEENKHVNGKQKQLGLNDELFLSFAQAAENIERRGG